MPGYQDLENFCCTSQLNRPDLTGVVSYGGAAAARPWFRDFLPRALAKLQKPFYGTIDGKQHLISGGDWRNSEQDTSANDPVYPVGNTTGIPYPAGFKKMKYVYVVNTTTGKVHRRPLISVSEEEYNTERNNRYGWNPAWGWWDLGDWWDPGGWDYILGDGSWCGHRVRWYDYEGMFRLTHSPNQNAITLRMTYFGTIAPPATADYTNNTSNFFTNSLFEELSTLTAAYILQAAGEDTTAATMMDQAVQMIGDAWRLNQQIKAGSNSRVLVPTGYPSSRGW